MSYKTLIGFLIEQSTGEFHFQVEGSKHGTNCPEVRFRSKAQADATPKWDKIAISVQKTAMDGEYYAVSARKPWFTRLEEDYLGDGRDPNELHIGFFMGVDLDTTEESFQRSMKNARNRARIIEKYYVEYYRGLRDVKCRAFGFRTDANPNPPFYAYDEMRQWAHDNPEEMDGFSPTHWHIWRGRSQAWCGVAPIGGNRGTTFVGCPVGTTIHELGHNLRRHHSNVRKQADTGVGVEYSDKDDIMGSSSTMPGFNAVNHWELGLESTREVLTIDHNSTSQRAFFSPVELRKHSLHENEWSMLRINTDGEKFGSLRKTAGYPRSLPPVTASYFYLYELSNDGHSVRYEHMVPGDIRTIGGVTLQYLAYDEKMEIASFIITTPNDVLVPPSLPAPQGFPKLPVSADITDLHSGPWYNKYYFGQGLNVHVNGDRFAVFWFGNNERGTDPNDYSDKSANAPRFYYGSGTTDTGEFTIYTTGETEDGVYPTFEDGSVADVREFGKARIHFLGPSTGVLLYNTPEWGRGSIELEPIALSDNPNSGHYCEPGNTKQGFSIQFFDYLARWGRCAAYWFTYGPPLLNNYNRAMPDTCQRWYMLLGNQTGENSGVYELDIFEVSNGQMFRVSAAVDINVDNVGSAILTTLQNDRIRIQYDLTAEDNNHQDETNLERLI